MKTAIANNTQENSIPFQSYSISNIFHTQPFLFRFDETGVRLYFIECPLKHLSHGK